MLSNLNAKGRIWILLIAWILFTGLCVADMFDLSDDIVLPTATHGQIRLRCVTQPDLAQAALLDRLGNRLAKAHAPRRTGIASARTQRLIHASSPKM